MAYLQRIPVRQLIFPAKETAGQFIIARFFKNRSVTIQIGKVKIIYNRHNIYIAGIRCLLPQITALQPHINKPIGKCMFQQINQFLGIFFDTYHTGLPFRSIRKGSYLKREILSA